ncbi:MAG: Kelch repeat-containing protein [Candidatus Bipolaricaulaceae bacterium]
MRRISVLLSLVSVVLSLAVLAAEPWTQGPSLNVARYKCRALVFDGKIYVIGGRDPKNVAPIEVFDPLSGKWEVVGPSPANAYEMPCVAAVGGKIYSLGGRTADKVRTKVGYVWDPTSGKVEWVQLPGAATQGHGDAAYAVIGTKIYLITGEDDFFSNDGWDYGKAVDVFDTSTYTWSLAAPIPFGREDFDAVAVGNKIFVFGGQGGAESSAVTWLDIYDAETDSWTHIEEGLPIPWEQPRVAAIGKDIYVVTGKGDAAFFAYKFDTETLTWTEITPPPVPIFECAMVALDGKIYVIGGQDFNGNTLATVWVYDPNLDK